MSKLFDNIFVPLKCQTKSKKGKHVPKNGSCFSNLCTYMPSFVFKHRDEILEFALIHEILRMSKSSQ